MELGKSKGESKKMKSSTKSLFIWILVFVLAFLFLVGTCHVINLLNEPVETFCENEGGIYSDYRTCLIKENGHYISYKIVDINKGKVLVKE